MNKTSLTINWVKAVIYGIGFIFLGFLSDYLGGYIDEKYVLNYSLEMGNKINFLAYPILILFGLILYFLFPKSTLDAFVKLNEPKPLFDSLAYGIIALIVLSLITFILIAVIYSF